MAGKWYWRCGGTPNSRNDAEYVERKCSRRQPKALVVGRNAQVGEHAFAQQQCCRKMNGIKRFDMRWKRLRCARQHNFIDRMNECPRLDLGKGIHTGAELRFGEVSLTAESQQRSACLNSYEPTHAGLLALIPRWYLGLVNNDAYNGAAIQIAH
jgi:hypothetical protein